MHYFILVTTAVLTALIAGLFYSYSCSVMPGLAKMGDKEFVAGMNAINVAIINPVFMLSFMGTAILLPLSTYLEYRAFAGARFYLLLAASIFYLIGTFGVTMFGNVPLNDALARINANTATAEELYHQRMTFEGTWNKLNSIRTIASLLSLISVIMACLSEKTML